MLFKSLWKRIPMLILNNQGCEPGGMGCSFDGECCSRNCVNYVCKDYPLIIPPGGEEGEAQGEKMKSKKLYMSKSTKSHGNFYNPFPTQAPQAIEPKEQPKSEIPNTTLAEQTAMALAQTNLILSKLLNTSNSSTPISPITNTPPEIKSVTLPESEAKKENSSNQSQAQSTYSFTPLNSSTSTSITSSELASKLPSQEAKDMISRLSPSNKIIVRETMGQDNRKKIQIEFDSSKKRRRKVMMVARKTFHKIKSHFDRAKKFRN